jgi:hypothetical protein
MDEGVPGLLRDKTRPSRIAPLSAEKKLAIIEITATEKPANAPHWSDFPPRPRQRRAERGRRSRLADATLTRCHDDDFAHSVSPNCLNPTPYRFKAGSIRGRHHQDFAVEP